MAPGRNDEADHISRRRILSGGAIGLTTLLAGCMFTSSDSDEDGVDDRNDDYPEDPDRSQLIRSYESNALFITQFRYRESLIQRNLKFDYEIESLNDKPINIQFLSDRGYFSWRASESFDTIRSYMSTTVETGTLSNPEDFENNLNILLTPAGDPSEGIRVYFKREIYR